MTLDICPYIKRVQRDIFMNPPYRLLENGYNYMQDYYICNNDPRFTHLCDDVVENANILIITMIGYTSLYNVLLLL